MDKYPNKNGLAGRQKQSEKPCKTRGEIEEIVVNIIPNHKVTDPNGFTSELYQMLK